MRETWHLDWRNCPANTEEKKICFSGSPVNRKTWFLVFSIVAVSLVLESTAQSKANPSKSPARDCSGTIVLRYEDFGPQAAAYDLIGYQWYQWLDCPCGDSNEHEIKVVVYGGIPLKAAKRKYPVVKGKIDYRYLEYKKAVAYLDSGISFNNQEKAASLRQGDSAFASMSEGLVELYQKTRAEILKGICRE